MSDANIDSIRLGTRNSPLALIQANMLADAIAMAHQDIEVEIIAIQSAADWKKQDGEVSLSAQEGGKGQFAKEIETMHLQGKIDCGVHSLKDMPAFLPEGLQISHVLPRANPCDAFISAKYKSIDDLPEGAVIGTCSPRRQALVLSKRPDLKIVPFRGNVQTRLDKVAAGQVDATFLAMAGIERLAIHDDMIHPLAVSEFLPACGQGIVCMEIKSDDAPLHQLMDAVHCVETGYCAVAEREVLKILDGSCHTPIAAYAVMSGSKMHLKALVASLDGQQVFHEELSQLCHDTSDAIAIGQAVGNKLKKDVPEGILQ